MRSILCLAREHAAHQRELTHSAHHLTTLQRPAMVADTIINHH